LKKIITAEKISGVEFVGYQTGDALWKLVAGAEAIVVPSRWYENAPYTIIGSDGFWQNSSGNAPWRRHRIN